MRRFAIEPALLPLLRTMHAEANGEGPVVEMREQKWWGPPISANPSKPPASNASPLRNRRHSQAPTLPRPPRYGPHVDGHPRRRPAENPTARRPRTFEMTQKYIRTAVAVGEVIGATLPPLRRAWPPDHIVQATRNLSN